MGETTDQIERQIRVTREELNDNFSELEYKVKTAIDWRAQFEEHPGTMLAIAFGGGLLLSGLLPSIPSRKKSAETFRDIDADTEYYPVAVPARYAEKPSQASKTLGALQGALIGIATSKLKDYIEEFIPGFKQEFMKAQSRVSLQDEKLHDRPSSTF